MKTPIIMAAMTATLLGLAAERTLAHGGEDHSQDAAPPAAIASDGAAPRRLPDGSLYLPKGTQHRLGVRTVMATIEALAVTVELNGRVIADPNAGGRVQAIQPGRIEPGPEGLPTLGQRVTKGQVLAWLRPAVDHLERGNQQALLAELGSQLAIAERQLARYERLTNSVPQKEIEATRIEVAALKKRLAAVGASLDAPEALSAPVSGVIGAANAVAGQVVESKEILFEIVDPERLAVEALAYDPALIEGIAEASAPLPGGSALELDFVGAGMQLRAEAIPLLFRVRAQDAAVAVGQPLKLIVRTSRTLQGAALPLSALVRVDTGDTVVWVHTEAERFVPRRVSFQALDATTAVVTAGVEAHDRIVIEGAALLTQVR